MAGVPEIAPVDVLITIPAGNCPEINLYEIPPPVAVTVLLMDIPSVAVTINPIGVTQVGGLLILASIVVNGA